MSLETLTPEDIRKMSYNELIGVVRETNRPPGGLASISAIVNSARVGPDSKVLDIGCSTGFTAIELSRMTGCTAIGIDINEISVSEANERAAAAGLPKVTFQVSDATDLPFEDGSFDLVFCGNVTSLISAADKALSEYLRVLKPDGILAAIPMYYLEPPDLPMLEEVRAAIQVPILAKYKSEATEFFRRRELEVVNESDWRFSKKSRDRVQKFCDMILERPHLLSIPPETRAELASTYRKYLDLFARNLSIMGYTVMSLRRNKELFEDELFDGVRLNQ